MPSPRRRLSPSLVISRAGPVLGLVLALAASPGAMAWSLPTSDHDSAVTSRDGGVTLAQRSPRRSTRRQQDSAAEPKEDSSDSESSTKEPAKKSTKKSAKKSKKKKKSTPKRASGPVAIPIDVGIGPQLLVPNPPLFFEQPVYTALNISIAAVISKQLINENRDQIPKQYRDAAKSVNEVRIRPWWLALVPSTIVISPDVIPGVTTTGMYGATWRPLGIGIDLLSEPVRFNLHADLALSYLFLHSQLREPTHFLRPGVTLSAILEVPLGEMLLVSMGWASDLYIPQPLSQPPWTIFPLEDSLFHLGGPFLKLHVRIPYEVSL